MRLSLIKYLQNHEIKIMDILIFKLDIIYIFTSFFIFSYLQFVKKTIIYNFIQFVNNLIYRIFCKNLFISYVQKFETFESS